MMKALIRFSVFIRRALTCSIILKHIHVTLTSKPRSDKSGRNNLRDIFFNIIASITNLGQS